MVWSQFLLWSNKLLDINQYPIFIMATVQVTNNSNSTGVQNNAGRDINIYHYPEILPANEIKPIKFHFPKPIESFKGREDELKQLTEWFFTNNKKMVNICGCAGYGKTELGKQFVSRCKDDKKIRHILWMEAETTAKLLQSFRELLEWLQLPEAKNQSLVEQIYEYFESSSYIIVFDNAIDRQQILQFAPPEKGLCLVTSHVTDWYDDVLSLKLSKLSLDAATDVFRAVLGKNFLEQDVEHYRTLAETVSCVPLALQIAAACVRQEILNLKDEFILSNHVQYVQNFYEEFIDKPIPNPIPNTYDKSVYQAIQISLYKIQSLETDTSKLACHVLNICAYLYSEEIWHTVLLNISYLKELLTKSENPDHDLNRACTLLSNYSFICDINKKISIHKLIQDAVIFQQKLEENIHYYLSCMEFLLLDNNMVTRHCNFLLQYPEKRLEMFKIFFSKHKSDIISSAVFFEHLIATNCKVYLCAIFNELGTGASYVIDKNYMLHESVRCGQHDILELLLEHGADVLNGKEYGLTVLLVAVNYLDLHALQILISHKSDLVEANEEKETVLHLVIQVSGEPQHIGRSEEACEMLRFLAESGARTDATVLRGATLLHTAAYALTAELFHFLVQKFNQNANARDNEGRTPLYYVSYNWMTENKEKRLKTMKYLLELGAEIDIIDDFGITPAEYAHECKFECLARYLENPSKNYEDIASQNPDSVDILRTLVLTRKMSCIKQKLDEFGECAAEKINEYSLLHEAAKGGQKAVINLLMQYGPNVNNRNTRNLTALHIAIKYVNLNTMKVLVAHGADINATDREGNSVLHYFLLAPVTQLFPAKRSHVIIDDMLRWMVDHGALTDVITNYGDTLLHTACNELNTSAIEFLVYDLHQDVQARNIWNQTPLYSINRGLQSLNTTFEQAINMAEVLLKHGAKLDVVDVRGLTPAQDARARGLEDQAMFLENTETEEIEDWIFLVTSGDIPFLTKKLNKSQDVAQKINKFCLLHIAAVHWQVGVLELLLAYGANINYKNDRNITPLHIAARQADLRTVKFLVNHEAKVYATNDQGVTVLHALALSGRGRTACAVLRWLAQHGADTRAVTRFGVSLLHVAAAALDPDLVRDLVFDFQHNVHVRDAVRQTPLFYVSRGLNASLTDEKQAISTAKYLIELGAYRNIIDADGFTPAQDARVWGFDKLAVTLKH